MSNSTQSVDTPADGCETQPEPSEPEPSGDDRPPEPGSPDLPRAAAAVELCLEVDDCRPPMNPWLAEQMRRVLSHLGLAGASISIAVVDDDRMAAVHEAYRQESGTTDVLTFDLREDDSQAPEGEIVVCLDEAARQAQQRGHDTRTEVLLYALHGLLHLVGYDDRASDAFDAMHRKEDEVLTAIGIGPVYAASRDTD